MRADGIPGWPRAGMSAAPAARRVAKAGRVSAGSSSGFLDGSVSAHGGACARSA